MDWEVKMVQQEARLSCSYGTTRQQGGGHSVQVWAMVPSTMGANSPITFFWTASIIDASSQVYIERSLPHRQTCSGSVVFVPDG